MSLKIVTFLLCWQTYLAFDLPRSMCHSNVRIDNDGYNMSNSYDVGEVYPTDAHFDVHGNLFYVESGNNEDGFFFNINVIKFKTTTPHKIQGLPKGMSYSVAVDKNNSVVYFGTGRGLYTFDYDTSSAVQVSEHNANAQVDMIFVDKDGNKFVAENNNGFDELYLLDSEKKIRFHTLEGVNEITIDGNNNFYYIKDEKLCALKSNLSSQICFGNITYTGMAQISIHNDNIFVASQTLSYFQENSTGDLKVVENIPSNVTAVAFDNAGDFVLGVKGKILKYKKNECHNRDNRVVDEYVKN